VCVSPGPPVVSPTNGTVSPAGQPIGNCPLVTRANRRQDWAGGSCWGTETRVGSLSLSASSPCYHSLPSGRTPAKLPSPPKPSSPPLTAGHRTGYCYLVQTQGGGEGRPDCGDIQPAPPTPGACTWVGAWIKYLYRYQCICLLLFKIDVQIFSSNSGFWC